MAISHVQHYLDQVTATFAAAAGRPVGTGTSVVSFGDRTGATAVAYLLPGRTLIAAADSVLGRLRALDGGLALAADELERRAADIGARLAGVGVNLVLPPAASAGGGAAAASVPDGWTTRWLNVDDPADATLLDSFVATSSADDLDEIEFDTEHPDPAICVLVGPDGSIGAYASGRPFWAAPVADDIGVLVSPAHRGLGLGAAVVRAFVDRRRHELPQLYRHDVNNAASAGVARAVGFVEAHRVVALDLGEG